MVIYYLYPQHNLNRHVVVIFSWHETVHNTAVKGKVQSSLDLPFPCNPSIITLCHKEKKRKRIQTKIVKNVHCYRLSMDIDFRHGFSHPQKPNR